jgi:hypothetical protein
MKSGSKNFEIIILSRAEIEIDEISDYYESIVEGLGFRFYFELRSYIDTLHTYPFFQNRYDTIRILPLKKFPYSIHFTVDENNKIVTIHAITCDYQNPDDYWVNDFEK